MTITITKKQNVLTDEARRKLYKALETIRYDYPATASNAAYEQGREYEFKNTIGTVKVTFEESDLA